VHFVIAQKKPAAIGEPGMRKSGKHVRSSRKKSAEHSSGRFNAQPAAGSPGKPARTRFSRPSKT
jgi:hypothetical protein